MLNKILERKIRDKHGKYGKRKCKRESKYMGEKGERKYAGEGMLNKILRGKVRDKTESTGV